MNDRNIRQSGFILSSPNSLCHFLANFFVVFRVFSWFSCDQYNGVLHLPHFGGGGKRHALLPVKPSRQAAACRDVPAFWSITAHVFCAAMPSPRKKAVPPQVLVDLRIPPRFRWEPSDPEAVARIISA